MTKNNITPKDEARLLEIQKCILGYIIRNTARSSRPYLAGFHEGQHVYADNGDRAQPFLTIEDAAEALSKNPDGRYCPEDFEIVPVWNHLPDEPIIKAFLDCLRLDPFTLDEEESREGNPVFCFKNGDNRLCISYMTYDFDPELSREKLEEVNDVDFLNDLLSLGFTASENILLDNGFISVYIDQDRDYNEYRICFQGDCKELKAELKDQITQFIKKTVPNP